ncbi:hypothetical protein J7I98_08560 [Streptomyces sp. ISL-98]|uniref:hypothetical protein n=1 Tax=Streptomyces sp. ISL-98 TaxID=2819192 RepID=UPI001BE6BB58|nr:hypothetical protein [Streptomyces sp. ISL-98]MBT2505944.1 hypothetical protein [Streptomyces sp. ISL-98]
MTHERDDLAAEWWNSIVVCAGLGHGHYRDLDPFPDWWVAYSDSTTTRVGNRLRFLLLQPKLLAAISTELAAADDPAAPSLSSTLLAEAEEFTGLPAITSDVARLDEPKQQSHRADAHRIRELQCALTRLDAFTSWVRDTLAVDAGLRHYQYVDSVPPHESSPCGVVRLRAPLVPRAPGSFSVSAGPQGPFISAA